MKVYQRIAQIMDAYQRCLKTENALWAERHKETLVALCEHMPSGSGFDAGTTLDLKRSTANKLVFSTSYHHMNENGFYCGWSDHDVIVKPSLAFGFDLRVTGRNVREIKDYIAELFDYALSTDVD